MKLSATSIPKSKPCLVKRMSSGETSETESVVNAKDGLDDKDVSGHVDLQTGRLSLSLDVTRSRLRLSPNLSELIANGCSIVHLALSAINFVFCHKYLSVFDGDV